MIDTAKPATSSLLAYPFRSFFLLTGVYSAVTVLAWIGFIFGGWELAIGWSPTHWHSHEMIYGVVPAAIAGFVLTAVTNWTNSSPLKGLPLLMLILLWVAGRIAFWSMAWLPASLVTAIDLAFLPVLATYLGIILIRHNNKRNLVLVAIIALLAFGNLLMHIGFIGGTVNTIRLGQSLGLNLVLLMMIVIAGRITPLFTINWLKNNGGNFDAVKRNPWIDRFAIISVAALMVLDFFSGATVAVGILALAAGLSNALRLALWSGWRAVREPMIWILHIAYLWIVIALFFRGFSVFFQFIPDTLWQHAVGVGAIATLILGVMTRVSLGHTGRPMKLPRFGLIIYLAIIFSSILRIFAAAQLMDYRLGVTLAALSWMLAFMLFVVLYWPILNSPRLDGRPG
jgi:uncharacterized protein involved in response to NO